ILHGWLTAAVGVFAVPNAVIGSSFDPFPGETRSAYHVDLRKYFATPEAELVDRHNIFEAAGHFGQDLPWSFPSLRTHLDEYERLQVELHRHEVYLHLRSVIDTTDLAA